MCISRFSATGFDLGCIDIVTASKAPSAPGMGEQFLRGAMADLIAKVDGLGQSTTEVGKAAIDYWSSTPAAAIPTTPPLPLLPSVFKVVRDVATLPFAPAAYAINTALPVVVRAQTIPFAPVSELASLPKTMLEQMNKA